MSKTSNPDVDFGFHATIPRLIRTEYRELTPVQKWLYVCLKDLCGEHGTCYRTIKVLSAETGISTGMLSESIPVLHKHGLIHSEKKRRSSGGKEVWHITIVDIWQANGKLHPAKRSQSEQTLENVHSVNMNIHSVNDKGLERSQNEQKRSLRETEEGSRSSINIEAVSSEEESVSADASRTNETSYHIAADAIGNDAEEDAPTVHRMPAVKIGASHAAILPDNSGTLLQPDLPSGIDRRATAGPDHSVLHRLDTSQQTPGPSALPSSVETPHLGRSSGITSDQASSSVSVVPEPAQTALPPAPAQATGKPEKPKRGRKEAAPVEELPTEVVQFLDDWDSLHRAPLPRTDRLIALATAGVQAKITREELKGCRNWLPTTDRPGKPYYRHKGVGLWDVIDKIGEYRSLQNMPIPGVPVVDMKPQKPLDPNEPELGISGLPKWKGPMPVYD